MICIYYSASELFSFLILLTGLGARDHQNMAVQENGQTRGAVAGVFLEKSNETITIYQAFKKRLLKSGTCLALLEAQAATEGIIDPLNNRKLSVEDAVKEGIVGPEMKEKLQSAEKARKGYVDPYTNQPISLFQAIQKDVIPKEYGIRLLEAQISAKGIYDPVEQCYISEEKACELGHYEKGIFTDQVDTLRVFYDPNSQENLSYSQLVGKCFSDPQTGLQLFPVYITFKGLRRGVTSTELLASKIIDQKTYDDLQKGTTTTKDVMLMETVKEYLEGKGSIGGVAVLPSNEKMSIYQAMKKSILMPGTALILLEAQAATGFMIDPVENKQFSVDDAIKNKLVGPEYHAKLLAAERAVTGYKDPYTGKTISLFQALSKDLIVKEHGIRLLEAQIATGGIIDPINSHRVPVDVAYKRGFFDEDMNTILEDSGDDTKGFFDPNTKENLTYLQLIDRCVIDPATGLTLLPLYEETGGQNHKFIDYKTKVTFKGVMVKVTHGKYKGMTVSLWELLMSEYFTETQRQDIFQQYRKGTHTVERIITYVLEIIEHSERTTHVIFEGIRDQVTADQLAEADIITKNDLEKLKTGSITVEDITEDESVQIYLQGKTSIAGVLLPDSQVMTIYQARRKGVLRPGTSLILLEAQAATGFIIDPITNRKFSVADAVKARVVGPELHAKLLSAEKAVTGYKDPYTNKTISLFQAMQKELILKDHGIRLLEAQIATGGIIDPVNSHRIPVHIAYKKGYFDVEMNQILDDPSDDTKGFFDPNTQENLTYLQLMNRCVTDPSTGLRLLPIKGKDKRVKIQDSIKEIFQATYVTVKYGRFSNKKVTLWDLINSEYLSEEKRMKLTHGYTSKTLTIEKIITIILEIIENKEVLRNADLYIKGLKKNVSILDLLKLNIIDEKTYKFLLEGKLGLRDILQMDSVRNSVEGTSSIAGVILKPSGQKMSIYEAKKNGLLTPGTALCLLEAQAATGFITDPIHNQKLSVEEALKQKLIGPELYEKLLSAEGAVTGYKDPYTGNNLSLFQAMKKDLVLQQHGIRLLEAQIATGGIIDPLTSVHLPLEVAYKKGYFDADINQILLDPSDDTKGFFDPNTKENLTYKEMTTRCIKDPGSGFLLLPLTEKGKAQQETENILSDSEIKKDFEKNTIAISVGRFSGKSLSLWELISSEYFTDEQRQKFIEQYRSKLLKIQDIVTIVLTTIKKLEQREATLETTMGLRKPVSVQQLFDFGIIDARTYQDLQDRKTTLEQVVKQDSVQRYLKGTGCIAGVKIHPSERVLDIYEAKTKGLLSPDMALILLEAQAATGFVIEPIKNSHHSVEEAAKEQLIGPDLLEHLLLAEQAVTGFTDPYTGEEIALLEAIKKDLIPRNHGLRLMEAQLATGGIIDPVLSHRLPASHAIKRGCLDEEISQLLANPDDDTKWYSDQNTKGNLTYQQLRERCIKNSNTGLLLLPVPENNERSIYTDEQVKTVFKEKSLVNVAGKFEGLRVSLWDVLMSEYITANKRKQLIEEYKSGKLTMEELIQMVIAIIIEVTTKRHSFKGLRKQVSASELFQSKIITKEMLTKIINDEVTDDEINQTEFIQKFLGATNCIAGVRVESTKQILSIYDAKSKGLLTPGTSLVLLEAQAATGFMIDPVKNKKLSVEEAVAQGVVGTEWKNKLLSAERAVTGYTDPHNGNTISLFQALKKDLIVKDHGIRLLEAQIATGGIIDPVYSHRVPVEVAYQRGYFDEEMNQILSDPSDDTKGFFDPNTQENLTYLQLVERCVKDPETGLSLLVIVKKGEYYFFIDEHTKNILKSTTTNKAEGKFQGQVVSLWDLLHSKYITEEKRRDLVQQLKSGTITIEYFLEQVLTIIQQKTSTPTFQGIKKEVTAEELLKSKIIDKKLYEDLSAGKVTADHISKMDSVRKYLQGTDCIAGVFVQSTKQTISIYDAKSKGLLTPGTSLVLLEAQAATGFVIDPVKNKKHSVEDAVAQGVVGTEWKNKLLSAERAVTGYTDPHNGNTISLFQALKKDLIVKDHGIRLLEAQIATGGIIDPVYSHRVPVEVAYQRGYFDEEMNQILSDPSDDTKGFFDPNTQENLTYLQLVERCVKDPETGLSLLVIVKKGEYYFFIDEHTKNILKSTTTNKAEGKFQGQVVSLWDLLHSKYITEEKRRDLVQQLKSVTAEELLKSKIIDKKLYEDLSAGKVTADHISKMDSVRKYLQGTDCIAGVFVQSTKQTISIYDAKSKGLLTPGTSLVLLEAQAATGFVIDPVKNKKHSVEDAVAQGVVGTEWKNKLLSAERAVTGKFQGQVVSLWDLLHSKYITEEKRRDLVQQLKSGTITIEYFLEQTFQGIKKEVTAEELLKSKIIDKKLYEDLSAGKVTADHISKMDSVRKYLQGTDCIAGVFVQSTKQTISIYDAKSKGLLTPGTSLVLLEAQAATGFVIDPVKNKKHSVEDAVAQGVVGTEWKNKLLSAERAVTGYTDPHNGNTISLFQALKKDLIVKDHGIRLLEAQIATGGIIDPVYSHRVPVEVAYQRGYFDEEMNQILSDPSDDTKGFFDPNTKENLTYLQLVERCVKDPETGLSLLVIVKKGEFYFFIDEHTKNILKSTTTNKAEGKFQGQVVSLWDLLHSKYITEEKRRDLVQQLKSGTITIEYFLEQVLTIIQQKTSSTTITTINTTTTTETKQAQTFQGIKKEVTAEELLKSKIIDKKLYEDLSAGKVTADHISKMDSVRKYLQGTDCIAGVFVQSTKQTISIYDAKSKGLLTPGTSLVLLEAQAATGFVIDPVKNKKHSVEEAVAQGVVGTEWKNKLLSAERAVTGYTDPHNGNTISLFQALKKDLIVKDHGIRLLEAQIATGGIIDPVYSHRVPVEVAYQRGYFDEEMNQILSDPSDDTKGFFDPNTKENLTYLQLVERCVKDPETGLSLLVIVKKGEFYFFIDEHTKNILKSTTTNKAEGKFQGQVVSLWDLLHSKYITEEKRRDLVQQLKSGTITIEYFLEQVLTIIQQKTSSTTITTINTTTTTETKQAQTFQGIKKEVTAEELLKSKIIDKKLYEDLSAGKVTADHISKMDSVRKYLQGTDCIAGVFVQSTKQTISIYDAKSKGLLTPGTSLVLLEAQAATGFVIDPVKNKKHSVEEAVAQGVVGTEWKNKLLSAERAVTGYTDPHNGNTISLFQALKKDLIVKDHGIRLLEAQIATGGIIDPVYSHRVPVEVAYQRGYFDEEMNQILSDPSDDTKGFFDPNTQENLTYLQLVERCVKDPETGLSLLVIVKKGEFYFFIDEHTKNILKSTTTNKAEGKFQGQVVSLWDLLHSKYITEEKRRDLVQQLKSGTITIEYFLEQVLTIIQQKTSSTTITTINTTTTTETKQAQTFQGIKKEVTAEELLISKIIDKKLYEDLSAGKVTADHISKMDSVRKYLQGTDCIAGVFVQSTKQTMSIYDAKSKGLLTPGTSLVLLEAQAATGFVIDPVKNKKLSVEEAVAQGVVGTEWKNKLLSAERAVTGYTDPHTENTISLFQALKKDLIVKDHGIRLLEAQIATGGIIDPVHSHRVPVEVAYQRGYFDEEMNQILSDPGDDTKGFFDPNTKENLTYLQLIERCVKDPNTGLNLLLLKK
uniref:Epiplakin 1 n=1 Tax=Pygocentrus nattereri TaxID=42514 RepID=A0AAR2IYR6_PYGNA